MLCVSCAGVCGGANIGAHSAMFEQARSSNNVDQSRLYFMLTQLQLQLQGARHVGLDIAGKDVVNPTGILLSSVM